MLQNQVFIISLHVLSQYPQLCSIIDWTRARQPPLSLRSHSPEFSYGPLTKSDNIDQNLIAQSIDQSTHDKNSLHFNTKGKSSVLSIILKVRNQELSFKFKADVGLYQEVLNIHVKELVSQ